MNRYKVVFLYADKMSRWEWRHQICHVYANSEYGARKKCIELYGLGLDCEYRILEVARG